MTFTAGIYDVIVVGAGHAGIEAAAAAAKLGQRTLCLCTSLDAVGNMPCNPSIGGTAKGQLVREIDALGGVMGRAADACSLQFRMLNRGKGPAVFSPRSQSDRLAYRSYMKHLLEHTENLSLVQGECTDILTENGAVSGVVLDGGAAYRAPAVVLATGTFLRARTLTGEVVRSMGPDGLFAANALSDGLTRLGFVLRRFKTGTPMRIDGRTVDFSQMEVQPGDGGDEALRGFVFGGECAPDTEVCYLTYTNEETHAVIRGALERSPLFTGVIEGVGPRYCPSIEDKVVRFSDKPRHQLFLEPCGRDSSEYYLQGLSTSLPEDVQHAMLRTIPGLENARIMRAGYAIEYDCLDPLELTRSLALKRVPGLFAAGQLCGSSGYEEAAAQGLMAGINAALLVQGKDPFTLQRSDGYIGVLIDDLVTRGTGEPYRMMTSRNEYRLLCRQDNADVRLMPYGAELGLISPERLAEMQLRQQQTADEIRRLQHTIAPPSEQVNALLRQLEQSEIALSGARMSDLLRRPGIGYDDLAPIDPSRPVLSAQVRQQVEIEIKYEGYIQRQTKQIAEQQRLENRPLPRDIDYLSIASVRTEARQKLAAIRPETLGQASRISGVSPSDIGALLVWLSHNQS